ncbi:hypothetical protein [Paenibacillus chungangensis]|uniref:Uncharacterized protein n=1 Tax=Paenibacillus chungangensis TaxID=696535 RepID=A0ABW3HNQ5_9BACL
MHSISKIEKVVAEFNVWPREQIPFAKFKVKILETESGEFIGLPNIAVKDEDGCPDWISGVGKSIDEALADAIKYLYGTLQGRAELTEQDFEWSDPHDF